MLKIALKEKPDSERKLTPELVLETYKNQKEYYELSRFEGTCKYACIRMTSAEFKQQAPQIIEILKQFDFLKTASQRPFHIDQNTEFDMKGSDFWFSVYLYKNQEKTGVDKFTVLTNRLTDQEVVSRLDISTCYWVFDGKTLEEKKELKCVAYALGMDCAAFIPVSVEACNTVTLAEVFDWAANSTPVTTSMTARTIGHSKYGLALNYDRVFYFNNVPHSLSKRFNTDLEKLVDSPEYSRQVCGAEHKFMLGCHREVAHPDKIFEKYLLGADELGFSFKVVDYNNPFLAREHVIALTVHQLAEGYADDGCAVDTQALRSKASSLFDQFLESHWKPDGLRDNVRVAIVQGNCAWSWRDRLWVVLFVRNRGDFWKVYTLDLTRDIHPLLRSVRTDPADLADKAASALGTYLALAASAVACNVEVPVSLTEAEYEICKSVMHDSDWAHAEYLGTLALRSWAG